ncbi:MAG: hypothetical protein ABI831_21130 [Betaproteobacteria bacterium]
MKRRLAMMICGLAALAVGALAFAATPQQEKQFVDAYKKAYEGKDAKALTAMLYTKGADPQGLEFYKMMMTGDMSGKISSIQLLDLTADDRKRAESGKGPDGRPMKLVLPATKKLVTKSEMKDKNGSSSSSSEIFVGESDGRLYVLVPAAGK